ncbi:Hypothetical predicted protein [Marmota monax]|uniref:Uncharacterized protein n=1 Tax=Marmota monax TaxID=9995 RepID=A0A5E4AZ93_MARMO|nr:hypothetical protein GHT09_007925 [Marmota monax]VTJ62515.1 Hypothetical predicted protein [Marmota monax]
MAAALSPHCHLSLPCSHPWPLTIQASGGPPTFPSRGTGPSPALPQKLARVKSKLPEVPPAPAPCLGVRARARGRSWKGNRRPRGGGGRSFPCGVSPLPTSRFPPAGAAGAAGPGHAGRGSPGRGWRQREPSRR